MIRYLKIVLVFSVMFISFSGDQACCDDRTLFSDDQEKKEFALEISSLIGNAWHRWQDSVTVDDIDVEGSQGMLSPGDIKGPVLSAEYIMEGFNSGPRSAGYSRCVRAAALAIAEGMRLWQRGYVNDDIPFPQGATCVYTLTPCCNVPVLVSSGRSSGDDSMGGEKLYSHMLYRSPGQTKEVRIMLYASSEAIAECFKEWQASCSISDILAKGGVAPAPAPMGNGPGLVNGAKGNGGKLTGAYFNGDLMYKKMCGYFDREPE